jgi:hypothetical protein
MIKKCSSFFSQEIKRLRQAKLQSLIQLWFYDETEFSLNSTTLFIAHMEDFLKYYSPTKKTIAVIELLFISA